MRKQVLHGGGLVVLALLGGCHLLIGYRDAVLDEGEGGASGAGGAGDWCQINGIEDGQETARDCGGPACPPCGDGKACEVGTDCASEVCAAGICRPAACDDGVQNGAESDVDCGGGAASGCAGCADGAACQAHGDCRSGVCEAEMCATTLLWARQFGPVEESRVAATADGDVVMTGLSAGNVNLGGGTLIVDNHDVLGAGYDADGQHRWSNVFGDAELQLATDVVMTDGASAVAVGYFAGQVDFGGQPLTSTGSSDVFLVKFRADGFHEWSTRYGDQQGQSGRAVSVGSAGDIHLAGTYNGTINFGGSNLPSGNTMGFVVRLDDAAGHVWSRGFAGISPEYVATDASGNVLVAGFLRMSSDLGGGTLPYSGSNDWFLLALSPSGSHRWSRGFVAAYLQGIALDGAGDVVLAGRFSGPLELPGVEMTSAGYPGTNSTDIFLIKLGSDGVPRWSRQFGSAAHDSCYGLAIDPAGNLVLTVNMPEATDIGGAMLQGSHLLKLSPDGNYLWSQPLADENGSVGVSDLAAPDPDHVVLLGQLHDTFDLGAGPMTSQSYGDLVLARFLVPSAP